MSFVYHSYKLPCLPSLPHRADGDAIDRLPQPHAPFAAALGASLARPVLPLRGLALILGYLPLVLVVALSALVDVPANHSPVDGKLAERLPLLAGVAFLVCHVVVGLKHLPAQSTPKDAARRGRRLLLPISLGVAAYTCWALADVPVPIRACGDCGWRSCQSRALCLLCASAVLPNCQRGLSSPIVVVFLHL